MVQFRRVIFLRKWLYLFIVECLFPARLSSVAPTLQLHPTVSATFLYSLRTFRLFPCPAPHRNHPHYFLVKLMECESAVLPHLKQGKLSSFIFSCLIKVFITINNFLRVFASTNALHSSINRCSNARKFLS